MANFPENIAGSVLRIIELISKLFARVRHCVGHFAVGSSKTRQITIRGPRKITTNHDMRPIGLTLLTRETDSSGPRSRLHCNRQVAPQIERIPFPLGDDCIQYIC